MTCTCLEPSVKFRIKGYVCTGPPTATSLGDLSLVRNAAARILYQYKNNGPVEPNAHDLSIREIRNISHTSAEKT